jgi:tetratricopeptide (TPR) repeat protein
MKKVLLIAVIAMLLIPQFAAAKEKTPFRIYLDDRTPENFLKAYKFYNDKLADTMDYGAVAVLAYLNKFEMERSLGVLDGGRDSLTNMNKFQYANILLDLGKYDEAIALYDQLNEKSPKWSCPWRHKGEAYWKQKNYPEAVTALQKAIETRETHYDAYVMLANVYKDMGENAKALETLEKGLTYYGKDIEDPEKEVGDLDMEFLHLQLLKLNGKTDEYNALHDKLQKIAPDDERLK